MKIIIIGGVTAGMSAVSKITVPFTVPRIMFYSFSCAVSTFTGWPCFKRKALPSSVSM